MERACWSSGAYRQARAALDDARMACRSTAHIDIADLGELLDLIDGLPPRLSAEVPAPRQSVA
jgi:hypothetical protein